MVRWCASAAPTARRSRSGRVATALPGPASFLGNASAHAPSASHIAIGSIIDDWNWLLPGLRLGGAGMLEVRSARAEARALQGFFIMGDAVTLADAALAPTAADIACARSSHAVFPPAPEGQLSGRPMRTRASATSAGSAPRGMNPRAGTRSNCTNGHTSTATGAAHAEPDRARRQAGCSPIPSSDAVPTDSRAPPTLRSGFGRLQAHESNGDGRLAAPPWALPKAARRIGEDMLGGESQRPGRGGPGVTLSRKRKGPRNAEEGNTLVLELVLPSRLT